MGLQDGGDNAVRFHGRGRFAGRLIVVLSVSAGCSTLPDGPGVTADPFVGKTLAAYGLPALAAAVVWDGDVVYEHAEGVRKKRGAEPVLSTDRFHLGSNTKAMTAIVAALLVQDGFLRWDSTAGEILGDEVPGMNPACRDMTLTELLSHTAGVPAGMSRKEWLAFFTAGDPVSVQRKKMASLMLKATPESVPGTAYLYSNFGYVIAGRMLEVVSGKTWEDFVASRLFTPLGMDTAGFGPPAAAGKAGPWGHNPGPVDPDSPYADNPPGLGPAGTVHASLRDLEKYASLYLSGGRLSDGSVLLTTESMEELARARLSSYALGWVRIDIPGEEGYVLQHDGSNTMFYAVFVFVPSHRFAVIVLANCGTDKAGKAAGELARNLVERYDPELLEKLKP